MTIVDLKGVSLDMYRLRAIVHVYIHVRAGEGEGEGEGGGVAMHSFHCSPNWDVRDYVFLWQSISNLPSETSDFFLTSTVVKLKE